LLRLRHIKTLNISLNYRNILAKYLLNYILSLHNLDLVIRGREYYVGIRDKRSYIGFIGEYVVFNNLVNELCSGCNYLISYASKFEVTGSPFTANVYKIEDGVPEPLYKRLAWGLLPTEVGRFRTILDVLNTKEKVEIPLYLSDDLSPYIDTVKEDLSHESSIFSDVVELAQLLNFLNELNDIIRESTSEFKRGTITHGLFDFICLYADKAKRNIEFTLNIHFCSPHDYREYSRLWFRAERPPCKLKRRLSLSIPIEQLNPKLVKLLEVRCTSSSEYEDILKRSIERKLSRLVLDKKPESDLNVEIYAIIITLSSNLDKAKVSVYEVLLS